MRSAPFRPNNHSFRQIANSAGSVPKFFGWIRDCPTFPRDADMVIQIAVSSIQVRNSFSADRDSPRECIRSGRKLFHGIIQYFSARKSSRLLRSSRCRRTTKTKYSGRSLRTQCLKTVRIFSDFFRIETASITVVTGYSTLELEPGIPEGAWHLFFYIHSAFVLTINCRDKK